MLLLFIDKEEEEEEELRELVVVGPTMMASLLPFTSTVMSQVTPKAIFIADAATSRTYCSLL
jgi:hypothetical protein